MSGYREHSYDPYETPTSRRPVRPFNWVQWMGVAFMVAGLAVVGIYAAGRVGWMPELVRNLTPVTGLTLIGVLLINSRQEPVHDIAPELAPERQRWLIIVTVVCVVVLGAATVLTFMGV
jgi:hypothetical protein